MNRLRAVIVILLASAPAGILHAQSSKQTAIAALQGFVRHYNSSAYDSVFVSFTDEMKAALPIESTRQFLTGVRNQNGRIRNTRYDSSRKPFEIFILETEKGSLEMSIAATYENRISGFLIKPWRAAPERTRTSLRLPFDGNWTVTWGGDTPELNYHVESHAQKNAFDFVITDSDGKSFSGDSRKNESYYAFGKKLFAPADGVVVLVVDGIKDNLPGIADPTYVPGNTVIIRTRPEEYLFLAHFKQQSIVVKEGQYIKKGQLLGLCGNSGNSTEPHLHFHIQNRESMPDATGIKCFFQNLVVNGVLQKESSPVKGENVRNADLD